MRGIPVKTFIYALLTLAAFSCDRNNDSSNTAPSNVSSTSRQTLLPSPSFKVAFTGDQGLSENSRAVLRLIKNEGTDLLIIDGDFDYQHNPSAWEAMLDEEVGDLPILAAIGNHDLIRWPSYSEILEKRLAKMSKAKCRGEIGIQQTCVYEGLLFVISGIGTRGNQHEAFLQKSLAETPAAFKICVWHKNQQKLQAGSKTDDVGWPAYEICRIQGAMVANAHEHSYSRTHLLSNFQRQEVVNNTNSLTLRPGHSFAFVSGLGGKSIREQKRDGNWFARIYTKTQNAVDGALFCEFNVDGNPRKAHCQFKTTENKVIDDFELTSAVDM